MILALFAMIGYYTAVYLRYKLLVWLAYRFLSGVAHKYPVTMVFKDTLVRAGLTMAVLYPLGWFLNWYANNLVLENVDKDTDNLLWLGFLPVLLLSYLAWKVIKREFATFLGLFEKDWNWSMPSLSIFHISPENMPERTSRIPDYGEKKKSAFNTFFSNILDIKCTPSDAEWYDYQRSNYDRIYNK